MSCSKTTNSASADTAFGYTGQMADAGFEDPRLVQVYDVAEGDRPDLVHYERIVTEYLAQAVIDVGCGTGTLACRLARSGKTVVGVDPAGASLDVAKAKPGADRVRWVHGDARALGMLGADMAIMTGNVAQVFVTDHEWSTTLNAIHTALRPGGYLVFETRDPASRGWEEWTPEQSRKTIEVAGDGPVEIWVQLTEVSLPYISFRWTYRFGSDGAELISDSTLRFRSRDEITTSLAAAGFEVIDVRDAPDRPKKEFVFIAQRGSPVSALGRLNLSTASGSTVPARG